MKLKNLIAFISFATLTTITTSCGDSYEPITLTSIDGSIVYTNNDTIRLIKFKEGVELNIKGGDGKYIYEIKNNSSTQNISGNYSSESNILTLTPKSEGECFIYISDTEDNSSRFLVQVKNLDRLYTVKDIKATAIGGNLTMNEKAKIESEILNEALTEINGRFEFYYINKNFDSGNLKIYPTESTNDDITKFFYQKEPYYNKEGHKVFDFNIYSSIGQDKPDFILHLTENEDQTILSQDLTEIFREQYNGRLESASIEYILSNISESDPSSNK